MSEQRETYPDRVFKEIPDNSEWLKQRKRKRIYIGIGILIFLIISYFVIPPLNAYKESLPLKRIEKTAQVSLEQIDLDEWYYNQARLYVFLMFEEMGQYNYYIYSLVDNPDLFYDEEWHNGARNCFQTAQDLTEAMINLEPISEKYEMTNLLNHVLNEITEINAIFKSSESGMEFLSQHRVLDLHLESYENYMGNITRLLEIAEHDLWLIVD